MVNSRLLTDETALPVEMSGVQRSFQLNFLQPKIPCKALKVIQNALANAPLHKARQDKDRADFTPLQIKHACRHGFSMNTPKIEVFFHQVAISVLGSPCRPDVHLLRGIGADALVPYRLTANVECRPAIAVMGSFDL